MPEEIDHIAELEKRLYARDPDAVPKRKFGILRPLKNTVDSSWGQDELPEDKTVSRTRVSPYKRLFIASLIFFLVGLAIALFSIYRGAITLSSKNVELLVLSNSFVGGGEYLPVQIDISNKNSSDLTDVNLTLSYPRGSTELPGEVERVKKDIGIIGSGKTKSESFSITLYGEQGMSRDVTATLEYKLAGSNAVFVKEKVVSIMINTSPVTLTVDAPTTSASGQPFTITIRTVFTGDTMLDNTIARIEYPNGFSFLGATPEAISGNNTWDLKDMVKGTERIISIKGRLTGEEQDEKTFRVYIGQRTSETDNRIAVSYNSTLHSIMIAQPFLNASIAIGGESSDVIALPNGSNISGKILWENNTPLEIVRPGFKLDILSEDIDPNTVTAPNGYYDQLSRSIIWDTESNQTLVKIESGDKGEFPFSFSLKPGALMTKEVGMSLSVKGTLPQRDFFEEAISNIDQKTIRFASRIQFSAQALYSIGPIKNTGPFPAQVDKETTFTILWTMRPVENTLSNASAKAVLPPGVLWTGVVSPQSEAVTYVPETRTITWNIGSIGKATNIVNTRSVAFQVKVKPSRMQVNNDLVLLGETVVTATDTVANVPLEITRPEVTNRLSTDPIYSPGKEKVLP